MLMCWKVCLHVREQPLTSTVNHNSDHASTAASASSKQDNYRDVRSHSHSSAGSGSTATNSNSSSARSTALPMMTSPHAYQNVNSSHTSIASSSPSPSPSHHDPLNTHPHNQQNLSPSHQHHQHQAQHHGSMNIMTNASTRTNLHRVALYDNVHPHFYTPKPLSAPIHTHSHSHASKSITGATRNANAVGHSHSINMEASMIRVSVPSSHSQNHKIQQSFSDEDFVTIHADVDVDADGHYHDHDLHQNNHHPHQQQHHHPYQYPQSSTPSMETKNHLSASKTSSSAYGHQMDILSLLLSSVSSSPPSLPPNHNPNPNSLIQNPGKNTMMEQCETASQAAAVATKSTKQGNISEAVQYHIRSSNAYKSAAMLLRSESGKSDLSFLAYSLLVLSNAQARSADCLVKHGGVSVSLAGKGDLNSNSGDVSKRHGNSSVAHPSGNDDSDGGRKEVKRPAGKEDRLRAKIRASLNTAEADMTDSTFLGRAVSNPQGSGVNRQGMSASVNAVPKAVSNPVDDMMELEQELKDMDATLNMGVNLGASTSSVATKKSMDGSFCVVPGSGNVGSSYMSSSIMWASGMGVRPVAAQQHSNNTKNRVQTHLGVSSMHKSPSIGGHQQLHQPQPHHLNHVSAPKHHPGLESSWWGQTSALASSTSSLSNSMVGIRSSNIGTGNHTNANNILSPANNKQVFRLLDSLKTLGDENAALLREVEETKKAQAEAKAAREAMRQFKQDYKQKFTKLKLALEKHRRENPASNNMVSNSSFMRKNHISDMQNEIQKRDKMIQKMKSESQKKDDALRKYEKFYQQVKLRSEQKKKQKDYESKKSGAM